MQQAFDTETGFEHTGRMRIIKWLAALCGAIVATLLLLDTCGGYLFDGPLGPIPGGAFEGMAESDADPDWSQVEEVIELEIRPSRPWSLSVWAVVVDGELYTGSAHGARRRWTPVVLEDPRVRVRTNGRIYERTLERVTDPVLIERIAEAIAARYELERDKDAPDDTTWFFHYAPRSPL